MSGSVHGAHSMGGMYVSSCRHIQTYLNCSLVGQTHPEYDSQELENRIVLSLVRNILAPYPNNDWAQDLKAAAPELASQNSMFKNPQELFEASSRLGKETLDHEMALLMQGKTYIDSERFV